MAVAVVGAGTPVLFGVYTPPTSATTAATVAEQIGGLGVPAPVSPYDAAAPGALGRSTCPQSLAAVPRAPLKFGYDVSTACVLSLNRAQFQQVLFTRPIWALFQPDLGPVLAPIWPF